VTFSTSTSRLIAMASAYGGALLKRSIAAFDELKQSIRDIEFPSDQTVGEVRISAPQILTRGFVATAIDRLTRRYPRIVCHLAAGGDYRALEEREVDLAIEHLAMSPIAPDRMEAEILYNPARFVVAAKSNPWSRRRKVRLADLMNEPWALQPPDSPIAAADADAFRAAGLELPAATIVAEGAYARLALVAEGRFLTIASETTLRFAGRDMPITALPTDLPQIRNSVAIVTLKNRTLTPWPSFSSKRYARGSSRWQASRLRHAAGSLKKREFERHPWCYPAPTM
jgi:DNA-binding transcriptional LysR family regulator